MKAFVKFILVVIFLMLMTALLGLYVAEFGFGWGILLYGLSSLFSYFIVFVLEL